MPWVPDDYDRRHDVINGDTYHLTFRNTDTGATNQVNVPAAWHEAGVEFDLDGELYTLERFINEVDEGGEWLMSCVVCGGEAPNPRHRRRTPWNGRYKCNDCADTAISYCAECGDVFEVPPDWAHGGSYFCPCPEHSLDPNEPLQVCNGCGNEERCVGKGTAEGDFYCMRCAGDNLWMSCQGCGWTTMEPPPQVLEGGGPYLCGGCDHASIPRWMDLDDVDEWEFIEQCACRICHWFDDNTTIDPIDNPDYTPAERTCAGCDRPIHNGYAEDRYLPDQDIHLCQRCVHRNMIECGACHREYYDGIDNRFLRTNDRTTICADCVENGPMNECNNCGYAWGEGFDCSCGGLEGYQYEPAKFTFYSADAEPTTGSTPYLGWELEVEAKEKNATRRVGAEIVKDLEWAYPVHDGSLENGLEIVTHPMTYRWFLNKFNHTEDLLDKLSRKGFRAYDTETCGMHVHVSKASMTRMHRLKMIQLIYHHKGLAMCVGQRGPSSKGIKEYASFTREDNGRLPEKVNRDDNLGHQHYVAVNLNKDSTVELRFFRGTLYPSSFKKNIQFVMSLWEFTRKVSKRKANEANYIRYLERNAGRFRELMNYLQENYIDREDR